MNPLDRKTLGSTGLEVTRLGLGCASLGGLYGDISEEQATQVVQRALTLGLNLVDTAPLYGAGKSERRLGTGLSREFLDRVTGGGRHAATPCLRGSTLNRLLLRLRLAQPQNRCATPTTGLQWIVKDQNPST